MANRALRAAQRTAQQAVLPRLLAGDEVECPVCESEFRRFAGRICPRCLSPERQRLVWLYLASTGIEDPSLAVLHLAPEPPYRDRLKNRPTYVAGDLDPGEHGVEKLDATALPFEEGAFDRVIVNHVLEHIPDDRRAIAEFHRVLKPGGRLITQHPVDWDLDRTDEDPSITDPGERVRRFNQRDHVRVYGRDFEDRLREPGFSVTAVDYFAQLPDDVIKRCRPSRRIIHDCVR